MPKPLFINQLTADYGQFTSFFLVQESETKEAKNGSKYAALTLQDRTGRLSARIWDCGDAIAAGTYIKVEGKCSLFREELQITVDRWRLLAQNEIELDDFIPASKRDRDEMLAEVHQYVWGIADPTLRSLVSWLVMHCRSGLRDAPAAQTKHQPYLGGLLEHILALCQLSYAVWNVYPSLNLSLLISASILHDIGKVQELTYKTVIGYSTRGSLIGHLAMSLQLLHEAKINLELTEATLPIVDQLEHIIASHHGRREWGACEEPMTREATVFHQLDMIDSRMGAFDQLTGTGFIKDKGQRLYVPAGAVETAPASARYNDVEVQKVQEMLNGETPKGEEFLVGELPTQ